jgi:hypothetical protein
MLPPGTRIRGCPAWVSRICQAIFRKGTLSWVFIVASFHQTTSPDQEIQVQKGLINYENIHEFFVFIIDFLVMNTSNLIP